jgi:autotransporter-associated beta strand protein
LGVLANQNTGAGDIGNFIKIGAGTVTLSGTNTYTGTTTIIGGTLKLGAAGVIPDVSAVTVTSPGILDMNNFDETVGSIAGTGTIDNVSGGGTPTLTCGGNNTSTNFSGLITNTNGRISLTKVGAGTLIFNNGQIIQLKNLSISAGALTSTSGTMYISGNFVNSSTFTHNSGTVNFNGTTQAIAAATFNNVVVSGGGTKTLGGEVTVNGILTLTSGLVSTTTSNILTLASGASSANIGSDASHINGPMKKIGSTAFTFPIGAGGIVAQAGFTPVSGYSATTVMTAQYFHAASPNSLNVGTGIYRVSLIEYWDISNPTNGATCNITEYFNDMTRSCIENAGSDVVKVHYDADNKWNNKGGAFVVTSSNAGYITSTTAISSFSNDGIATTSGASPLPIELTEFEAIASDISVEILWTTATETNNDFFSIERSVDGLNWALVKQIPGAGNTTTIHDYSYTDLEQVNGLVYYRLQQTDYDGTHTYSNIVSVNTNSISDNMVEILYKRNNKNIEIACNESTQKNIEFIEVLSITGAVLYKTFKYEPTIYTAKFPKGVYYVYCKQRTKENAVRLLID